MNLLEKETPVAREFSRLNDRCDRCGAEAMYAAHLDDKELYFCAHHFTDHSRALLASGWLFDENPIVAVKHSVEV